MKKILSLDIGISSIGNAVVELDDENFYGKILDAGVRIFSAAEQPSGDSLAAPRREARGARRRISRRSSRLYNIKKYLILNNFITQEQIENLYCSNKQIKDVWTLRKEALYRKLNNEEFYRILMHIAKRRGFKSIRKSEEAKKEGDLLKAIKQNYQEFENGQYKTIGEMFAEKDIKRNKREKYNNSIPRDLLQKEIEIIFETQRKLGSPLAKEETENFYLQTAFYQRPLQSMEDKIGYCSFEPDEKRAPKCAYTSEIFTAATKLVNLSITDELGECRVLCGDEIKQIIELAHKNTKVTYKQLKKELCLEDNILFNGLNYNKKDKNPEDSTLIELKNYHLIKKSIVNDKNLGKVYFEAIKYDKDLFNNIATVLTCEKSDESVIARMKEYFIDDKIIACVKDLSMSKTMHLSLKAMEKILPYMLEGYKYNEACELAGYNHHSISKNKTKQNFLPVLPQEELTTNPVVNRAISQTRKVVNSLIKRHGTFDYIIIEMARDLSKSFDERRKIKKAQEDFQNQKELARKRCIENGLNPDYPKSNLLKFRLWEEQGGYCIYSGKYIDPRKLSDQDYTDVDHIIPYSKSFDDSLNNKVLCLSDENRQKGNKIPYEYIGESKWYDFVQRIKTYNLKSAKYNRLIRKSYESEGFKSRNLNDTRYITKFIKDYIKENLDFGNNLKVETRNGSLTAFLRTQWGLIKNREENDRHHALDAIVLACSTQGMVQYLSTVSAKIENYNYTKDKKPRFKRPWATFKEDVELAISKIFVSRALRASVSGQLHDATIRSPKHLQDGFTVLKTPLEKINLQTLEKMYDKERNIKIYNLLKERLTKFNNDPKKAFEEPVYMPMSEEKLKQGQKPHLIKTIKIKDNSISGIKVHNGFAQNTSMPRVDIFTKKNKKGKNEYFLVPIYIADFGGELPNKAISTGKNRWIEITDDYTFCFSLYPNTLIAINPTGKPEDEFLGYYKGCDITTGTIKLDSHDRTIKDKRISTKTAAYIKKYQVGVLGDYHEVKHEKRLKLKGPK